MSFSGVIKHRKTAGGLVLVALAAVLFFTFRGKGEQAANYTFVTFSRGTIESTISSSGTLNPVTEVAVGTQVSGNIEKVLVDFNDKVTKGQIIAVLDSALLQMAVTNAEADSVKAEAQWEEAKLNFKRSTQLREKELISESDFQAVKTTYKSAEAGLMNSRVALHRALQNLRYSIIRSPITGTVTARNIEAGQTVAASFSTPTLFTIAQDLSKMEITASVDESDIGQMKVGQAVRFTVQAYPSRTFTGVVKQVRLKPTTISNVVNYTVVISAENKENLLLPGMTATVAFVIEQKNDVLVVPNEALRFQPTDNEIAQAEKRRASSMPPPPSDSLRNTPPPAQAAGAGEWKRVWFLDNEGRLTSAPVQVGISDGTNTEILGGRFQPGMKVIGGTGGDLKSLPGKKTSESGGPPPPMM